MSLTSLQHKYDDFYTPRFEVQMGGTTFRESDGVISDLNVSTTLDGADHFSFTLNNLFDTSRGRFDDLDWDLLAEGPAVAISMGYGNQLEPMLVGSVGSAEPAFPQSGGPTVGVNGFGKLHDMMNGTKTREWKGSSDSDRVKDNNAVETVVSEGGYGFDGVDVDETDLGFRRIVQDNQTDHEFLTERAWRYDFEVFTRRDTFHFRAPKEDSDPEITLGYGDSLNAISLDISESIRLSEVEVRGTDPRGREKIVGSAPGNDPSGEKKTLRVPVESKHEADRIAEAEVSRTLRGRVRGSGDTVGIPELTAGKTIRLDGLAERFTGTYYIESADHRIGSSGYTTSFRVRLPEGTG